jgi:biopolymer transport protein TolR
VATELPAQTDLLVVTVDRSGRVYVGKTLVSVGDLAVKLQAIYERKTVKELFLRADKDVPYGVVVRVMAEAKKAGIERLGMVTEPVETL